LEEFVALLYMLKDLEDPRLLYHLLDLVVLGGLGVLVGPEDQEGQGHPESQHQMNLLREEQQNSLLVQQ
jgi:hypothetical protein